MTRLLFLAALVALVGPTAAQPLPELGLPEARGTSYFGFAEPGAPTVEVLVFGEGVRNGVYRLQEGTTLLEALALAGGTARSDSTERAVRRAYVRLLRPLPEGGVAVVYEATPLQLVRDAGRYPDLRTHDIIEAEVQYEAVEEPFTLRDGIEVASRVASLVSLVVIVISRLN